MTAARPAVLLKTTSTFPAEEFRKLSIEGLLEAPLREGWGVLPNTHRRVLEVLRDVGARDLSTGRLYEGHVNALMLVQKYGDVQAAKLDLQDGRLFGVWNTDAMDGVKACLHDVFRLSGRKAFASGAGSLTRPIVTAELESGGRQMFLLPMESTVHTVDFDSWQPMGMKGSDSFTVDFNGAKVATGSMLGSVNDYYLQPAFSGGAIRFAAVHLGGAERLAKDFVVWLQKQNRTEDPYQQARAGEIEIAITSGRQWIASAAREAELNYCATDEPGIGSMMQVANMTRLAIERICLDVMELVTRGIGARGLLGPSPFENRLRDLAMYLRQPAPDQALAAVGQRALLRV